MNPAHLSLGSHLDNMGDMAERDRGKWDTCKAGHPRTPENVQYYKQPGRGRVIRRCIPCRKAEAARTPAGRPRKRD